VPARLSRELERSLAKAIAERNEAQRIACDNESALNRLMFDDPRLADPRHVAKQRNWDCY